MKKIIKFFLQKTGYSLVKKDYLNNLVHVESVKWLDFHYLIKDKYEPNEEIVIFDIGANVGQSATKFHAYFPNAKIYCFEPIKSTYELLEKKIDNIPTIESYNLGFGDKSGQVEIFHREDSEWNSLVPVLNERAKNVGAPSEIVNVETIDNFLLKSKLSKIEILKSDTEGFELNVLSGAVNSLTSQAFDFIYLEVGFNPNDKQHVYLVKIIEFLEQYHYSFSGLFEKAYKEDYTIGYANALFTKVPFAK